LEGFHRSLRSLSERMAEQKILAAGPDRGAAARAHRELRRLTRAAGETATRLARRLAGATAARAAGDDLREDLVRPFLPFVIFVAKNYQGCGLSLPDLIQEGNIGLLKAADLYDPRHKKNFMTYAAYSALSKN
jgi:RNA polymerase primary sigma factor